MNLADRLIGYIYDRQLDEIEGGSIIIVIDGEKTTIYIDPNGNTDQVKVNEAQTRKTKI